MKEHADFLLDLIKNDEPLTEWREVYERLRDDSGRVVPQFVAHKDRAQQGVVESVAFRRYLAVKIQQLEKMVGFLFMQNTVLHTAMDELAHNAARHPDIQRVVTEFGKYVDREFTRNVGAWKDATDCLDDIVIGRLGDEDDPNAWVEDVMRDCAKAENEYDSVKPEPDPDGMQVDTNTLKIRPWFVVYAQTAGEMGRPPGQWGRQLVTADFDKAMEKAKEIYAKGWVYTRIYACKEHPSTGHVMYYPEEKEEESA